MNFSSTVTTESKTVPGVRFTVHKMGLSRRAELDLSTLDLRQRMREIEMDYPPLSPEEKRLTEYLAVAHKKALAVPADQFEAVWREDVTPLQEHLEAAAAPETRKARARLDMEFSSIDARLRVRWILAGLVRIEGGELDGVTPEAFVEAGPGPLALEVYEALSSSAQTAGADAKNSGSPGTSGAQVDTATKNTTAASAESAETMSAGTALSTSPGA